MKKSKFNSDSRKQRIRRRNIEGRTRETPKRASNEKDDRALKEGRDTNTTFFDPDVRDQVLRWAGTARPFTHCYSFPLTYLPVLVTSYVRYAPRVVERIEGGARIKDPGLELIHRVFSPCPRCIIKSLEYGVPRFCRACSAGLEVAAIGVRALYRGIMETRFQNPIG